jgi:hypothetical protein
VTSPFLSETWIATVNALHATVTAPVRVNLVVTGDAGQRVSASLDTTSGRPIVELGALDGADLTVTTDYGTAVAVVRSTDPATGLEAFLAGRVVVQGDLMRLVALAGELRSTPDGVAFADAVRAITTPATPDRI